MEKVSPRAEHAIDLFVSGESKESSKDNMATGLAKFDFLADQRLRTCTCMLYRDSLLIPRIKATSNVLSLYRIVV